MIEAYLLFEEKPMSKRILLSFFTILIFTFCLSGCNLSENNHETYLSLMTVPSNADVPDILTLVSILNITNPDPNNPEANLPPVLLGIFGFTNSTGEIEYYAYGKKEAIDEGGSHLIEEGFFPIDFSHELDTVSINLKSPVFPLSKGNPGVGVTTAYNDVLPYDFYTATDQAGFYSFTSATGDTILRVYARFEAKGIANFYPATEDGQMIRGALPVVDGFEVGLVNAGYNGAARLMTTPIDCTNVQVVYLL